jgi:hypothetical protein
MVKTRVKTNKFEEIPSLIPVEVVREHTTAEWLDGIPPVRQIAVSIASNGFLCLWVNK